MNLKEIYLKYDILFLSEIVKNNVENKEYYDLNTETYHCRTKQLVYIKGRVNIEDISYLIRTVDLLKEKTAEEILSEVKGRDLIHIRKILDFIEVKNVNP